MKSNLYILFQTFIGLILMLFICSGCNNDMEEVQRMTMSDTLPDQQGINVKMIYTEYGNTVFELTSQEVQIYQDKEKPKTIFPKGLQIIFYDSLHQKTSTLTADYAIKLDRENRVIAKRNVVIKNLKKEEQLNTEELIWNQKTKKIYTDKFVTILTDNQVLYGEKGMEADENFNSWTINKLKGNVKIDENEF